MKRLAIVMRLQAVEKYQKVIQDFPGTQAAKEAAERIKAIDAAVLEGK